MTQLMRERASIMNSEREIDAVLGQAMATRDTLSRQRDMFGGISDKMRSVAERIPVVQELMGKIKTRKNRDKIVLGVTIGGCLFFLVWWMVL
jgi:Golgi SNAP receptor complex protein 1|eukprot:COSAG06_NODE_970_length_11275_cov_4.727183_9_plen_92_part_00